MLTQHTGLKIREQVKINGCRLKVLQTISVDRRGSSPVIPSEENRLLTLLMRQHTFSSKFSTRRAHHVVSRG